MTRPTPTEGPTAAVGVVASGSFRFPAPGSFEAAAEGGPSGRRDRLKPLHPLNTPQDAHE